MTILKAALILGAVGLTGTLGVLYVAFGAFLPWNEADEAQRLAALADVRPGVVVGEIGSGSGRFAADLASRVSPSGRVYATELGPDKAAALETRLVAAGASNVTVVAATADDTKLPDRCCDVLVMRNVYHHIQDPDRFTASVRKAIRPGGMLVVMDFEPGALWFHGGRPSDTSTRRPGHGVSRAAATAELSAAGFRLDREITAWSGPMWLLAFRLPASDVSVSR